MIVPDNFFYFITLFTMAMTGGTYLLFSYYQDRLLILNALLLFGCAIRVCTEYLLPSVESFAVARQIVTFHSVLGFLIGCGMWICIWFYTRPLSGWIHERAANWTYIVVLIILPFIVATPQLLQRNIYYLNPEKIDGYWKFTVDASNWLATTYRTFIFCMICLMFFILLVNIIRVKGNRLRRSLLLFSYVIIPYIYFSIEAPGQWNTPSVGILYTLHVLIISWFISDYRLFKNNFNLFTQDMLNSISDLAIATDKKFRITHLNEAAKTMLSKKEQHVSTFLKKRAIDSELAITQLLYTLQCDLKIQSLELMLLDNEQRSKIFNMKAAPIQNGRVLLGYTFMLTDLTDIREKEQKLEALHVTKDRLFAVIAHDLRNPVLTFRGVGAKIEYLLQKKDYTTLHRLSASIENTTFSLSSLLDNLLNWALQQRGIVNCLPQCVQLVAVWEDMREYFEQIAVRKNIQLHFYSSHEVQLVVDPTALSTILRNLVDNALKFTPEGGTVTICESVQQGQVVLQVRDTGIGMNEQQLKQLFELRSRQGTKGEKGAGLGLILVKELVALNKGQLTIETAVQQGTTFTVTLPLLSKDATLFIGEEQSDQKMSIS